METRKLTLKLAWKITTFKWFWKVTRYSIWQFIFRKFVWISDFFDADDLKVR